MDDTGSMEKKELRCVVVSRRNGARLSKVMRDDETASREHTWNRTDAHVSFEIRCAISKVFNDFYSCRTKLQSMDERISRCSNCETGTVTVNKAHF
jgi:hypothetical protein